MNLAQWAKQYESVAIIDRKYIDVKFTGANYGVIVEGYLAEANRIYRNTLQLNSFDCDKLERYFKTLTWIRVKRQTKSREEVKTYDTRALALPAFFATIILQIGKAHDDERGIELIPVMDKPEDVLSPDECYEMSRWIRSLRDAFLPVDYPRDNGRGTIQFMSKAIVENIVKSYRTNDNVVYAFLASIATTCVLESVADAYYNVRYGDAAIFTRSSPIGEVDDYNTSETLTRGSGDEKSGDKDHDLDGLV